MSKRSWLSKIIKQKTGMPEINIGKLVKAVEDKDILVFLNCFPVELRAKLAAMILRMTHTDQDTLSKYL